MYEQSGYSGGLERKGINGKESQRAEMKMITSRTDKACAFNNAGSIPYCLFSSASFYRMCLSRKVWPGDSTYDTTYSSGKLVRLGHAVQSAQSVVSKHIYIIRLTPPKQDELARPRSSRCSPQGWWAEKLRVTFDFSTRTSDFFANKKPPHG